MAADAERYDMEKARSLVADQALWPRVRDFLWDFAPQVHGSWLEALDERREGQAESSLVSSLSTSPRVKKMILSSLGIEPFFHDFPRDDWSRLALLDGTTLESMARWLGALACAEGLRCVTNGAAVRALKAALPGVYPEVFSFTAYFAGMDLAAKNAGAAMRPDDVLLAGLGLLFAQLDACPPPLVSRLKFKFPSSLVSCLPEERREARGARCAAAMKKLLKLKFPEAYSLCCS